MSKEGNLEINSEEIMTSVRILDESLNALESNMLPSIGKNFTALEETGLFSEGLTKIKKQIESLMNSNKNLMTKLTVHESEFAKLEAELTKLAADYSSGFSNLSSGYSGGSSVVDDSNVNNVDKGKKINEKELTKEITKLDEKNQLQLIQFLNANKEGGTTLQQLVLDPSKSALLVTLLKKFYGDTSLEKSELSENSYQIQKELLKLLSQNSTLYSKMEEGSILVAKEYLESIAKENNIELAELLLDERQEPVLQSAIINLYDGTNLENYQISDKQLSSVRNLIDSVAKKNNVSAETVITDSEYLESLKGL